MDPSVFVHPQALVESDQIGAGTRIWAFAHVLPGAVIGADCNICDHAYIEGAARLGDRVRVKNGVSVWDQVTIEDDAFLGPNCVLTNDLQPRPRSDDRPDHLVPTLIKRGATIGANATVLCGITLGEYCFVGAGAVITGDVPAYAMMVGVPARKIGYMCSCGERIDFGNPCPCGRRYELTEDDCREVASN